MSVRDSTSKRISRKVHDLIELNQHSLLDRQLIRTIMDGGKEAVSLLLGNRVADHQLELPIPNLMLSASNRLAYKIGKVPLLRVDSPMHINSERAREYADKRQRIISGWNTQNKLEMMYPQIGRWLPGYGFITGVIKQSKNTDKYPFPCVELRDPYETYLGEWGVRQQPCDVAYVRVVRPETLVHHFPQHKSTLENMAAGIPHVPAANRATAIGMSRVMTPGYGSWENQSGEGIAIYEYYNEEGQWWVIPEQNLVLHHIPNVLNSGPQFVAAKRFSFNRLIGQYNHIIGLLAAIARINLNLMIAIEDSVHAETNIYGEMNGKYKRGRGQVNRFAPGTKVERPRSPVPFEAFQQANRLDEQLRIIANYPVQEDSVSPNSFVTGRGLEELRTSVSAEVQEYYTVLRNWQADCDAKQLEFAERVYGDQKLTVTGVERGAMFTETYNPVTHIKGNYFTRRIYGMMTGWDEPTKVVTGLQLLQAGIIDDDTMRDNMDGIDNPDVVSKRVNAMRAEQALMEQISMMQQQGDPRAMQLLLEMMPDGDLKNRISEILAPPEEQQAPPGMEMPPVPGEAGPGLTGPESTQTILERLTSSGEQFTGVQTVRGGA